MFKKAIRTVLDSLGDWDTVAGLPEKLDKAWKWTKWSFGVVMTLYALVVALFVDGPLFAKLVVGLALAAFLMLASTCAVVLWLNFGKRHAVPAVTDPQPIDPEPPDTLLSETGLRGITEGLPRQLANDGFPSHPGKLMVSIQMPIRFHNSGQRRTITGATFELRHRDTGQSFTGGLTLVYLKDSANSLGKEGNQRTSKDLVAKGLDIPGDSISQLCEFHFGLLVDGNVDVSRLESRLHFRLLHAPDTDFVVPIEQTVQMFDSIWYRNGGGVVDSPDERFVPLSTTGLTETPVESGLERHARIRRAIAELLNAISSAEQRAYAGSDSREYDDLYRVIETIKVLAMRLDPSLEASFLAVRHMDVPTDDAERDHFVSRRQGSFWPMYKQLKAWRLFLQETLHRMGV